MAEWGGREGVGVRGRRRGCVGMGLGGGGPDYGPTGRTSVLGGEVGLNIVGRIREAGEEIGGGGLRAPPGRRPREYLAKGEDRAYALMVPCGAWGRRCGAL